LLAIGKGWAEPVLRAAWPNGNSGGALPGTGWAGKNHGERRRPDIIFRPVWRAVFLTICATVLFAGLSFGARSQHEIGDIVALTLARRGL
jgi:hypothetical protein